MFILALLSLVQGEPLPTVFGLQLGAPIALPECARSASDNYSIEQSQDCEHKPGVEVPAMPERGIVAFLPAKMPAILSSNWIFTTVLDGKLEGLDASTLKYTVAEGVVDELTRKFGAPTSRDTETISVEGIPFPGLHVTWVRPGYTVEYHSVRRTNLDKGQLVIETDKARARRLERERAKASNRTPL